MISREYLLEALLHEINVCKHLFTKIPDDGLDFRLSEKQRSTAQVLLYLLTCGIGPIESLHYGEWSYYDKREKDIEGISIDQFLILMDKQAQDIREVFNSISDDDLANKIVRAPGVAGPLPLGAAIMRTSYAWLVAYRMQLFLQIKASGVPEINTANNWGGIDWKPNAEVVEGEETQAA